MDDMRLDTPLRVGLLFSSTLARRKGLLLAAAAALLALDRVDKLLPGRAAVARVGPLDDELPSRANGGRDLSLLPPAPAPAPAAARPDMATVL